MQPHYRVPGICQGLNECIVGIIIRQPQIDEDAVIPINIGTPYRLADDGQDAFTLFAGALCDKLFDPVAEARNRRRGDPGNFVYSMILRNVIHSELNHLNR